MGFSELAGIKGLKSLKNIIGWVISEGNFLGVQDLTNLTNEGKCTCCRIMGGRIQSESVMGL